MAAGIETVFRPAVSGDAGALLDIRRRAILGDAPNAMSAHEAEAWAAELDLDVMARKLRDLEVWVSEASGVARGWGAIRGDRLEGLYTDPAYGRQGVGSDLLGMLERLMRERGTACVVAEASANALNFYLRRRYIRRGEALANGALPIVKQLR